MLYDKVWSISPNQKSGVSKYNALWKLPEKYQDKNETDKEDSKKIFIKSFDSVLEDNYVGKRTTVKNEFECA